MRPGSASGAGPDDVTGASVADTFPAALDCTWTCAASAGSSCTAGPVAGDINDSVDLLAGGSATYTAICDVAPDASGTLSNTATVTAPGSVTKTAAAWAPRSSGRSPPPTAAATESR